MKKAYGNDSATKYVDAAKYAANHAAHAIAVTNNKGKELSAATVTTADIDSAEETAIALGTTTITEGQARMIIITDSQTAYRNFQKGLTLTVALNILLKLKDEKAEDLP